MDQILDALAGEPGMILAIILCLPGMIVLAFIAWVIGSSTLRCRRETEQSRRELAAYVAEGSITAEDAEAILAPRPYWARSLGKAAAEYKSRGKAAKMPC